MSPGARDRASAIVRFAVASLAIWAALALSTAAVAAQTVLTCSVSGQSGKCSPTVTLDQPATMVNPALLQLTVSPTASTYTATTIDMDQATGLATFTPISLTVQANRAWTIQVNGNAAFWTASAGAWASKPVSDLIWSLTPGGADDRDVDDGDDADDGIGRPRLAERDRLHAPNRTLGDRQAGQLLDDGEVHHDDAVRRWTGGQRKRGAASGSPFSYGSEFCYGTWMLTMRVGQLPTLGSGFAHTLN